MKKILLFLSLMNITLSISASQSMHRFLQAISRTSLATGVKLATRGQLAIRDQLTNVLKPNTFTLPTTHRLPINEALPSHSFSKQLVLISAPTTVSATKKQLPLGNEALINIFSSLPINPCSTKPSEPIAFISLELPFAPDDDTDSNTNVTDVTDDDTDSNTNVTDVTDDDTEDHKSVVIVPVDDIATEFNSESPPTNDTSASLVGVEPAASSVVALAPVNNDVQDHSPVPSATDDATESHQSDSSLESNPNSQCFNSEKSSDSGLPLSDSGLPLIDSAETIKDSANIIEELPTSESTTHHKKQENDTFPHKQEFDPSSHACEKENAKKENNSSIYNFVKENKMPIGFAGTTIALTLSRRIPRSLIGRTLRSANPHPTQALSLKSSPFSSPPIFSRTFFPTPRTSFLNVKSHIQPTAKPQFRVLEAPFSRAHTQSPAKAQSPVTPAVRPTQAQISRAYTQPTTKPQSPVTLAARQAQAQAYVAMKKIPHPSSPLTQPTANPQYPVLNVTVPSPVNPAPHQAPNQAPKTKSKATPQTNPGATPDKKTPEAVSDTTPNIEPVKKEPTARQEESDNDKNDTTDPFVKEIASFPQKSNNDEHSVFNDPSVQNSVMPALSSQAYSPSTKSAFCTQLKPAITAFASAPPSATALKQQTNASYNTAPFENNGEKTVTSHITGNQIPKGSTSSSSSCNIKNLPLNSQIGISKKPLKKKSSNFTSTVTPHKPVEKEPSKSLFEQGILFLQNNIIQPLKELITGIIKLFEK